VHLRKRNLRMSRGREK